MPGRIARVFAAGLLALGWAFAASAEPRVPNVSVRCSADSDCVNACNPSCRTFSQQQSWPGTWVCDPSYAPRCVQAAGGTGCRFRCDQAVGSAAPAGAALPGAEPSPVGQPIPLSVSIGGTTQVTGFSQYIATAYRYLVGVATLAAIVMVVYGGFRYLTGAVAGDVNRGKGIIQDAVIGLILVLGAYVILNTVNPATLTLRLPPVTEIRGTAGPQYVESEAQNTPASGGSRAIIRNLTNVLVQCNASDQECQNYQGIFRDTSGNIQPATVEQSQAKCLLLPTGGFCAAGFEGNICRCIGAGCTRRRCDVADPSYQCNNNGTGFVACRQGLLCVLDIQSDLENARWVCKSGIRQIAQIANIRDRDRRVVPCRTDAECKGPAKLNNPNAVCLMANNQFGYCSDGSEGTRCKCVAAPGGCRVLSADTNAAGHGFIACQTGLECVVTANGENGDRGRWYCQRPEAVR